MLRDAMLWPDKALVSTALRTRQTWERAAEALHGVPVSFDDRVYEAHAGRLLQVVRESGDDAGVGGLVGHNPGMTDLATILVGHGDRSAFARLRAKFVTAGVAVIDFDVDHWADIQPGGGRLERFVTPTATDD